jgi:DNA repair protein RadC
MTKAIIDIAGPLGISVHDHIIVGRNGDANLEPNGKKSKTSSTAC